ncbi:class II aldolase/adducin family protein [Microbacterium resistens]|uniref:Class II aldolase/adducin family protein n=1 Tax=Microbacterium resistens TaxID=156977 RepID=A0ABY3RZ89_9MICO|nr:class II aldolase/adducin family protein [Microbacterium resistens]
MPATVIAERVGREFSAWLFWERISQQWPEYQGVDSSDRPSYQAGEATQCDPWFPETRIPVGASQGRVLPVLVSGFSRRIEAIMLPSRQGGDLNAGMRSPLQRFGGVPRSLLWDREAAIGGLGKPTVLGATFAGTLATRLRLAPPREGHRRAREPVPGDLMTDHPELREVVALSSRIMAASGSGDFIWGHVSARDPEGRGVWLKQASWGLEEITPERVHPVSPDGEVLAGGASGTANIQSTPKS